MLSGSGRSVSLAAGAAVATLLFCSAASANTLLGVSVFGTLALGNPASGQYWPTQTKTVVSPGPSEFSYSDNANADSVNFGDTTITVSDAVFNTASGWTMTFESPIFASLLLTEATDNFDNGGVTYSLVGDLITFSWAGTSAFGKTFTATYNVVAAVPLPAALPLIAGGLGLLGAVGWRRRRRAIAD